MSENMEAYIALLLMIVPGFIAETIYRSLNRDIKYDSTLQETVTALMYNMPILAITCLVLIPIYKYKNVADFKAQFNNIDFVLVYIIITLIISIAMGFLWNMFEPKVSNFINSIRKNENKNEIENSEGVWDIVFNDGKQHAILIEKDGRECTKGFIKKLSQPQNLREMYVENADLMNSCKEYFSDVKGVYIDFDKNIKITEYDLTKLYNSMEIK
jgi:hypothetical protein